MATGQSMQDVQVTRVRPQERCNPYYGMQEGAFC
jgi:hypothetical protein